LLYNFQVSGFCPSSGILKTREHKVSETGFISFLRGKGEALNLLGHLERADLMKITGHD
jgi:hypothetical protein